jgi:hypothetical protein
MINDISVKNPYFIFTILFVLIMVSYFMRRYDERIAVMEAHLVQSQSNLHHQMNRARIAEAEATAVVSDQMYAIQRNQERLVNPLLPPERSYPYMPMRVGMPINISTRGPSSGFQQMGILVESNVDPSGMKEKKLLPIYGEETYPGSNQYRYYTNTDGFQSVKLPIQSGREDCMDERGCKELYDGDNVQVGGYDKGYRVQMYKIDRPRYNPMII